MIVHFVDGERGDDDLAANGVVDASGTPALDLREKLHQHPSDRFNVNDDEQISALDALHIIDELGRTGGRTLPDTLTLPVTRFQYLDVNGDGLVSANDALQVISDLNLNGARPVSSSPSGEPDSAVPIESINENRLPTTRRQTLVIPVASAHRGLPVAIPRSVRFAAEMPSNWPTRIDKLFNDSELDSFWDALTQLRDDDPS